MGKAVPETGELKLLWTNPNTKTSFAPQTVNLAGNYDAFYISFYTVAGDTRFMGTTFVLNDNGVATQRLVYVNYYTNAGSRDVHAYSNKIMFGNSNFGANGTEDNTKIIPYQIYGVQF